MPETTRKKILIVADEPDTAIFLHNLLCSGGFGPMIAENGSRALILAESQNPSVVIIDMMIAGEGGIKLYGELKDDGRLSSIPVIMLSTIDRKTFLLFQKSRKLPSGGTMPPPDAYLQKPPETDEFLGIVRRLTHNQQVPRGAGGKQGQDRPKPADGGPDAN